MNASIVPREARHLEGLVQLFSATHKANGYPVEGPPSWESPESWLEFFSGTNASAEVLGLVACQPEGNTNVGGIDHKPGGGVAGELFTAGDLSVVLGHVSLRRLPGNSIVMR